MLLDYWAELVSENLGVTGIGRIATRDRQEKRKNRWPQNLAMVHGAVIAFLL